MNKIEKPWFREYELCGIPKTLEPYPNTPVFNFLEVAAEKHPSSGIVQLGKETKYTEVRDDAYRLATALADLGIKKGDRVATILPTSIQFIIADYAISRAGGVHIPCSFLEPLSVLEHEFKEGTPKVLIYLSEDLDKDVNKIKTLTEKSRIEKIILTKIGDYSLNQPEHESIDNMLWLTELMGKYEPAPPDIDIDIDKDLETLLFSGGTTGLPKGCMLTHKNILANAIQSATCFGPAANLLNGNFSVLIGVPFYHAYGHIIMHTITYQGATQLLVVDSRDTRSIINTIKEYYPVLQIGVPTQYIKMLKEELKDLGILGISGSAALPPDVQEQFEEKSGGGLIEGYGLSECSPNTHINPSLIIRLAGGSGKAVRVVFKALQIPLRYILGSIIKKIDRKTIGKVSSKLLPVLMRLRSRPKFKKEEKKGTIGIPFCDTEIKVIDDTGRELSFDEMITGHVGELCINGPQRMLGYWPEKGSGIDENGYVHTGDVVKMDERGYFYIVDRVKDMINVSGNKVYSREIDDILYQHPAVELAATIGVTDPEKEGSERVKVYIQLKSGHKGKVKEEEFREYLGNKVARYALPKYIEFIDQMPLTGVQKVNKKVLRAREGDRTRG
ncbi:MAG: acyl--CoA ligase [Deltaproteobacteria bacterium]|nr:MAG: acyl--CoA ligase [Deltaproteobacteria bacterium]